MNARINLFFIPSSNKNNKYIELLLSSLKTAQPDINIIKIKDDKIINIFKSLQRFNASEKNIIHVQWSTVLYGSRFFLKSLFLIIINLAILLILKIAFKFKIVWTVHNNFAHDYPHPTIDALGRKVLFSLSNVVIVQQKKTLSEFKEKYPHKNIIYIPHGNYIGAYGEAISRDDSLRKHLGFKDDDIVLVSLGAIAPYKLNENIIDSVVIARKTNPKLKLLVIGKGDSEYIDSLRSRSNDAGVVIKEGFISDLDLPRYLSVADYSVFYYDESEMTSGGMILSLSYGVPVITRNIAASEIVTGSKGFIFENMANFIDILMHLKQVKQYGIVDDMYQYNWANLASKLIETYKLI